MLIMYCPFAAVAVWMLISGMITLAPSTSSPTSERTVPRITAFCAQATPADPTSMARNTATIRRVLNVERFIEPPH